MTFDRERFVSDLRALVKQGVGFKHQGRDPETGLDCINLPAWAYREQGLTFPAELDKETREYPEEPDGWRMREILRQWFIEIPVVDNRVLEAQPGDLLLCYVMKNPKHMAVIVDLIPDAEPRKPWAWVVEAWRSPDNKIGKLLDQPLDWRRRICACFRIPDFDSQA
jgi:hypothetical protein